jgi:hypothetical protein
MNKINNDELKLEIETTGSRPSSAPSDLYELFHETDAKLILAFSKRFKRTAQPFAVQRPTNFRTQLNTTEHK